MTDQERKEMSDLFAGAIAAGIREASKASPAPVVIDASNHREARDNKAGEWFVLKVIGSVFLALITAGLIAGMFWLINSVSDNTREIASQKSSNKTAQLVSAEQQKAIMGKIDDVTEGLKEVTENTKNRFTPVDFDNRIQPITQNVSRNSAAVEVLAQTLTQRVDFMSKTKTDIAILKRELGIKNEETK